MFHSVTVSQFQFYSIGLACIGCVGTGRSIRNQSLHLLRKLSPECFWPTQISAFNFIQNDLRRVARNVADRNPNRIIWHKCRSLQTIYLILPDAKPNDNDKLYRKSRSPPLPSSRSSRSNVSFYLDYGAGSRVLDLPRACFQSLRSPPAPLKKGGARVLKSPFFTPLKMGKNALKVPLFKGDLGGSESEGAVAKTSSKIKGK
jgi:hypothetical protein